jgi:hypothetical protein
MELRLRARAAGRRQRGAWRRAAAGLHAVPHLFACLLGSVVLVWSVLRLRDPQLRFGRYDGVARLLFTTWMVWTFTATGSPLLWLFIIPEFAWGVAQWLPVSSQPENQ